MTASPEIWSADALQSPHEVADKASRVRRMFDAIAPRYELVNSLFSLGLDRAWRRRAVRLAAAGPHDLVLDVACGTGDFARAFAAAGARVVGSDFAHQMLRLAARRPGRGLTWCEADALQLPFADAVFTVVSCAFGVRNFQQLAPGLAEMHRVLKPGGRLVILEFGAPRGRLFRRLYDFYSRKIMPTGATLVSGDRTGAYHYLPSSVAQFASRESIMEDIRQAGFEAVEGRALTSGVVCVFLARRAARGGGSS